MSKKSAAPFQVDRGLYLEKAKCLLPWDALSDELAQIGKSKCTRFEEAKAGYLGWRDEEIFGGLKVDVWYGVGGLRNTFQVNPLHADRFATPRETFIYYRDDLAQRLGAPELSFNKDIMNLEYPCAQWWFDSVRVSVAVGERFAEYFAFLVTKGLRKP